MKHNHHRSIISAIITGVFVLSLSIALLVSQSPAQLAGQAPLNPKKIPQFVDPLPHFAGNRIDAKAGGNLTMTMRPKQQVAVSTGTKLAGGTVGVTPGVGMAKLWAYEIQYGGGTYPANWPAFTIEAQRDPLGTKALNVTYVNALAGQTYADVGLVVDQTLHWADPLMQMPQFTPYTGAPPAVVHLHGGEVPPMSDGGPDAWFTPGNAETGHAFNSDPYYYGNTQEPATLWYHDHALGVTRLNVYAGMAGFYFLRGSAAEEDNLNLPGWSGDDLVREVAAPGTSGVFNPNPYLPEIEIAIQDRMFDTNGQLFFPNLPPNPALHPFWTPEFVGDVITVNGKTWPYLSVAPRKYRFRVLNGSNARFYELSFGNRGPVITQIGTDGGFMDLPVPIAGLLVLAPGERADVIIDFSLFAGRTLILDNTARTPYPGGAPVSGSTTGRIMQFVVNGLMVDGPDGNTTAGDNSVVPGNLRPTQTGGLVKLTDFAGVPATGVPVVKNRQLTLNEAMAAGGPAEILVNNTKWTGLAFGTTIRPDFTAVPHGGGHPGVTYYSETMDEGKTEVWKIINLTADAHPIHLHLVQFQLMSRQPFDMRAYMMAYGAAFPGGMMMDGYGPPMDYGTNQRPGDPIPTVGGNPDVTPFLIGAPVPANPNEKGWKDTFIMYPGEVTTVIARWSPTDKPATDPATSLWFDFNPNGGHGYVWHCHIIDHEDNEMMRPYNVTPNPNAPPRLMKRGIGGDLVASKPSTFGLQQNYPNPFNPTTDIRFQLPEDSRVQLKVYNTLGQEVMTVIDADAPAGTHTVKLDAGRLASGVYFYKIVAGKYTDMKKMMLLR